MAWKMQFGVEDALNCSKCWQILKNGHLQTTLSLACHSWWARKSPTVPFDLVLPIWCPKIDSLSSLECGHGHGTSVLMNISLSTKTQLGEKQKNTCWKNKLQLNPPTHQPPQKKHPTSSHPKFNSKSIQFDGLGRVKVGSHCKTSSLATFTLLGW